MLNALTCKAMDSKHDISKQSIKFKRFACLEAVKPKDIDPVLTRVSNVQNWPAKSGRINEGEVEELYNGV